MSRRRRPRRRPQRADPARVEARRAQAARIDYPAGLPITAALDDLRAALAAHPVVVVAGETGSGKTTQLPKLCLELGRGIDGMIGHTQPRRLAAFSVARRIADETGLGYGEGIGAQVRFDDRTGPATRVKLMTDGILLNEVERDPELRRYDTIIVDEAHERSLNIDFLLGCLKRALPARPDLSVLITSATINTAAFAAFFDDAPVIEVSGRGYPVELRYREPAPADTLADAVAAACAELAAELASGDILVFLPGEREIHDAERALTAALALSRRLAGRWEVLKVYGRLSDREQRRLFEPARRRRVVLATNIAETSLTVPRIHAVVDSGLVRLSRYSPRSKIQRLAVEPTSQASAAQRAGRCGRLGPGICMRLYTAEDFDERPEFTDPEMLRTSLASVMLRMLAAGLGPIERFPLIDPPDTRAVSDGQRLLEELNAVGVTGRITRLGRRIAALPLDPRLARVLLAASELGVCREALIVVAVLSGVDPRVRPLEAAAKADAAHAAFANPQSDLAGLLALWRQWHSTRKSSSRRATDRWLERNFLAPRRMAEWRSLHEQLQRLAREAGLRVERGSDDPSRLARAFLYGYASHVATRNDSRYDGARGLRLSLHPGSALAGRPPAWIVAVEIVRTARTYARNAAAVEPAWIERAAAHLVSRSYSAPRWDEDRRAVVADETATLYGLVLAAERSVDFAAVDVTAARPLFLRAALVERRAGLAGRFFDHNAAVLENIAAAEGRERRPLRITDVALAERYGALVPETIAGVDAFEAWYAEAVREQADILCFSESQLTAVEAGSDDAETPGTVTIAGTEVAIDYRFSPGRAGDGATLKVPQGLAGQVSEQLRDRAVPRLLEERIHLYLKALPKPLRRRLQPMRESARTLKAALLDDTAEGSFAERLAFQLSANFAIPAAGIDFSRVDEPAHLRVSVEIDPAAPLAAAPDPELPPADRRWSFGCLDTIGSADDTRIVALAPVGDDRVGPRTFVQEQRAAVAQRSALYRLASLRLSQQVRDIGARLGRDRGIALTLGRVVGDQELARDFVRAWLHQALPLDEPLAIRSEPAFERWLDGGRGDAVAGADALFELLVRVADAYRAATAALTELPERHAKARDDVATQLEGLVYPGFLSDHGALRLRELPRYLSAVVYRLQRLPQSGARDDEHRATVQRFQRRIEQLPQRVRGSAAAARYRWGVEELRVSLFAQPLGTAGKVSPKRLERLWNELTGLGPA